jgi:hypothetical protein
MTQANQSLVKRHSQIPMIPNQKSRRIQFGIALILLSILASGCESMMDGICDSLTHHDDVKYYEDRGVSHRDAERAVDEDNFFRDMNNTAERN